MTDSGGAAAAIELRARNRNGAEQRATTSGWMREDEKVHIEHVVQPSDSLYKLGLLYHVPVSEIKRVNNIHVEQEIHGLKTLRIPVTRLQQHYLNEKNAASTTAATISHPSNAYQTGQMSTAAEINVSDKLQLLDESTDEDDERSSQPAKSAIDAILDKTDATVAQCRTQLPSPTLEGGAFHFVDASAPDSSTKGTWLIIAGLVFMFVIIPLFLTMLEEHNEAEIELHHRQHLEHLHQHQIA